MHRRENAMCLEAEMISGAVCRVHKEAPGDGVGEAGS